MSTSQDIFYTSPYSFNITPHKPTISPRDIIERGIKAEEELYGGPGPSVPELPDDMAIIDGITNRLYDQWGKVQNFAKTMWHNYRIDVTKPDATNPLSVKANLAYNKMLAAIQYNAAVLKRKNEELNLANQAVFSGQGEYVQDPHAKLYSSPHEYFAPYHQYTPAIQSNMYQGTDKTTMDAFRAANTAVNTARENLLKEAEQARQQGLLGLARQKELEALQYINPRYERPYQLDLYYQKQKDDDDDGTRDVFNEILNLRNELYSGRPNAISRLKASIPNALDIRPIRTGDKTGVFVTRVGPSGMVLTDEFYFGQDDGKYRGLDRLNDWLQKLDAKYKIPTSILVKYFEQLSDNDFRGAELPDPNEKQAFNEILNVAYELNSSKDPDGKKEKLINYMNDLALQGVLLKPNGSKITKLEWKPKSGGINMYSEDQADPVVVDVSKTAWKNFLKKILEINSSLLIGDINSAEYADVKRIGTINKYGQLNLDPNMQINDQYGVPNMMTPYNQTNNSVVDNIYNEYLRMKTAGK